MGEKAGIPWNWIFFYTYSHHKIEQNIPRIKAILNRLIFYSMRYLYMSEMFVKYEKKNNREEFLFAEKKGNKI